MPTIQIRTDEATKLQAGEIFQQLGINMSDAINMFLRQTIFHRGLPFEPKIPEHNTVTLAALADMEQSKGEGVRGKPVAVALAELKTEE